MRTFIIAVLVAATAAAVALCTNKVVSDSAEAAVEKVTICHYDRNDQGPNAGPHTIEVAPAAVAAHLANHTKNKGYIGNDSLGACPEPTATSTAAPTSTPTVTETPVDPTATPTDTPTSEPSATTTPSPTATATATGEPTRTPRATSTAARTATAVPTATTVATSGLVPPVNITPPNTGTGSCDHGSALLGWATAGFLAGVCAIAIAWFVSRDDKQDVRNR